MQSEMKYIIEIIQSNSNHIQNKILNFDDKKIVDILEDNRILLPFLNKLKQSNNFQFDSLMSKIESRIKQDYVHQIDEKTEIFSNFMNELKIDWMSHKHLFFERQRADIDVLVPANKFFYVIEKLEEDNFEKIAIEPSKLR